MSDDPVKMAAGMGCACGSCLFSFWQPIFIFLLFLAVIKYLFF